MQHESLINSWPVVAWAMVPSLLGWSALLIGAKLGLLILAIGLLLQFVIDYRSTKQSITPSWFITLRSILTVGAVFCLIVGWVGLTI